MSSIVHKDYLTTSWYVWTRFLQNDVHKDSNTGVNGILWSIQVIFRDMRFSLAVTVISIVFFSIAKYQLVAKIWLNSDNNIFRASQAAPRDEMKL